jgi:transposase
MPDISLCSSDCIKKRCRRNLRNRKNVELFQNQSYCDFSMECEGYLKKKVNGGKVLKGANTK